MTDGPYRKAAVPWDQIASVAAKYLGSGWCVDGDVCPTGLVLFKLRRFSRSGTTDLWVFAEDSIEADAKRYLADRGGFFRALAARLDDALGRDRRHVYPQPGTVCQKGTAA